MKVRVRKYGIIHYYAQCQECDWDASIDIHAKDRNQKVRNKTYKHILETGHTVTIESGSSTDYYVEK